VEKDFETVMTYKSEQDREDFMKFCQLYSALGEVGFPAFDQKEDGILTQTKRVLYFMFLMLQPIKVPYAWLLYLVAAILSVV
jgi:hypothetical protein